MSYTPEKVVDKDVFTGEIEIKKGTLQRQFDLISQETKNLQAEIDDGKLIAKQLKIAVQSTNFRTAFLYG